MCKNNNLSSESYSLTITRSHYGTDRNIKKKMLRNTFYTEVDCAFYSGIVQACEDILKAHNMAPFESVDEFIGEVQIYMSKNFNKVRDKHIKNGKLGKLTVENLVELTEKRDFSKLMRI